MLGRAVTVPPVKMVEVEPCVAVVGWVEDPNVVAVAV